GKRNYLGCHGRNPPYGSSVNDGKPRASWMYRLAPKKLTLALPLAKVMPAYAAFVFQDIRLKPSGALSIT
ncbi:hypothetical protein, partial [Acidithiobacillus sp.]